MKKLSLVTLIVTAALMTQQSVFADTATTVNSGNITFTGTVLPNTCTVASTGGTVSGSDISVDLGSVYRNQIPLASSAVSGTKEFTLDLTNCETSGKLTATLSSSDITEDGDLKNLAEGENKATNVAVQVTDKNNSETKINFKTPENTSADKSPSSEGAATFKYGARIVKIAESKAAGIGAVTAKATYTISYEPAATSTPVPAQ